MQFRRKKMEAGIAILPRRHRQICRQISFEARFGEEYSVTITEDNTNGYEASLNQ